MNVEERFKLIKEVGEEIINEEELMDLLKAKEHPIAYDGFEPSGRIHIAQGLLRSINVNKLTKAGIKFKFWLADWFALMNNKLGGDLEKIKTVGEYFIEVWKACGMNLENVEFLWASENMNQEYWLNVIRIGRLNTVTRITRCAQIMGRSDKENLSAAQIFYPCMQATDIFHLKVDIAQLGMDQRKVNVLAREIAQKLKWKKPIAIHNHMLMGLINPLDNVKKVAISNKKILSKEELKVESAIAQKMSKSNPDSAIFMTDTEEEIKRKFKKAFCPEGEVENNPVLEYCKYIIFEKIDKFLVERPEKFGGNIEFNSYDELEKSFVAKDLHPMDLKTASARYINQLIDPVRKHFEENAEAKALLEKVNTYITTR